MELKLQAEHEFACLNAKTLIDAAFAGKIKEHSRACCLFKKWI